jgi:hypothetical protein
VAQLGHTFAGTLTLEHRLLSLNVGKTRCRSLLSSSGSFPCFLTCHASTRSITFSCCGRRCPTRGVAELFGTFDGCAPRRLRRQRVLLPAHAQPLVPPLARCCTSLMLQEVGAMATVFRRGEVPGAWKSRSWVARAAVVTAAVIPPYLSGAGTAPDFASLPRGLFLSSFPLYPGTGWLLSHRAG